MRHADADLIESAPARRVQFESWRDRAACDGMPVDHFYSDAGSKATGDWSKPEQRALRICARCPVRRECLADVVASEARTRYHLGTVQDADGRVRNMTVSPLPFGVCGGTTAAERNAVRKLPTEERVRRLDLAFRARWHRLLTPAEHYRLAGKIAGGKRTKKMFVVGGTPGPGRGRKGPAAEMAGRLGISVRTARRRLSAAA